MTSSKPAVEVVVAGKYACGGRVDPAESRPGGRERKLFLSSKTVDQHKLRTGGQKGTASVEAGLKTNDPLADSEMAPWKVKQFQSEVESFGMAGMDTKKKRAWESAREEAIGIKAQKGPRIAASIGRGMNAAKQKREQEEYEQAKLQGMATKKKSKGGPQFRDRGLNEDLGGKYSNGILHLKKGSGVKKPGAGGKGKGGKGKGKGGGKGGKKREIKIPGMS